MIVGGETRDQYSIRLHFFCFGGEGVLHFGSQDHVWDTVRELCRFRVVVRALEREDKMMRAMSTSQARKPTPISCLLCFLGSSSCWSSDFLFLMATRHLRHLLLYYVSFTFAASPVEIFICVVSLSVA